MRVALRLAYDGRFAGYARQPQGGTVEDHVIEALGPEGSVAGSWRTGSRTDRGVAAACNVAACHLDRPHMEGLVPAVQSRLPDGVWLTGAAQVDDAFDPRRAAWRDYLYVAPASGEDVAAMHQACQAFVGTHDMSAFARVEPGRSPRRTVLACTVQRQEDWWRFDVRGHSFLWNQVRRMVDAVLQVGRGRASATDVEHALQEGRPHAAFGVAPPEGLLLWQVAYDPEPPWMSGPPGRSLRQYAQRQATSQLLAARLMQAAQAAPRR